MTSEPIDILCDHAVGNYRILTTVAIEQVSVAVEHADFDGVSGGDRVGEQNGHDYTGEHSGHDGNSN